MDPITDSNIGDIRVNRLNKLVDSINFKVIIKLDFTYSAREAGDRVFIFKRDRIRHNIGIIA